MKTSKKKKLALKIDLSKAFDRVGWPFITKALVPFGFSDCWVNLISQCISTTSYFILLNGSLGPIFSTSRGLIQGDPLSPYLFLICMEVLSRLLDKATVENKISGIKINKHAPTISHLFFADDCFLFTKAELGEAKNLLDILSNFGKITGQVLNLQKSGIYFSPKIQPKHGRITSYNVCYTKLLRRILARQVQKPWVLIGDLNIILVLGEKQGGNSTSSRSKTFARQIIDSVGLQDAGYEGAPFTWSNNRSGEANICERIDRALISYQ